MDDGFHIAKQTMIFGGLTKKSQMIDAEKLGSVFDCDVHSLPSVIAQCYGHYVPCFRVDIPVLEMKYAQVYLSRKTVKFISIICKGYGS